MADVLDEEQLEELAAALRGTDDSLKEALLCAGYELRKELLSKVEELLLDKEETERCPLCGFWAFSESFGVNSDDDRVCSDCAYEEEDDEIEED